MIDYSKLTRSLQQLQRQLSNHQAAALRTELSELDREGIAESVIQRFETCYDTLWKILKRYLTEVMGVPDVPNSPKPVLRLAFENHLLPSPIEQWLSYADARTATAHDYSGEKARACLLLMPAFVADAIALHTTLTEQTWE